MKNYNKPQLIIEELMIEDIILTSTTENGKFDPFGGADANTDWGNIF